MMRNALMARRQCVIDVQHPARATVKKEELRTAVAKLLKVKDEQSVIIYGVRTDYGGNRSTGFALIYDSVDEAKKRDKQARVIRMGLAPKVEKKGRKGRKETKCVFSWDSLSCCFCGVSVVFFLVFVFLVAGWLCGGDEV